MKSKGIDWILTKQQMQSMSLTLAMTLTLDFQGQILKHPYLRNRRANWHLTTGVILDRYRDLLVTKMRCEELPDGDRVTSFVGVPSTRFVDIHN